MAPSDADSARPSEHAADDAVWAHFLAYLRMAPALPGPQEMLQDYGRTLAREGMERPEVERRIANLLALMRRRAEAWPLLFDRIYASPAPRVSEGANRWLMTAVDGHPPGRALEIAVGHGRNAVALAARGWDVTGFDVSEEGLAVARASAERAGVHLTLKKEPDETFAFGVAEWDLVAVIYGPVSIAEPVYARRLHRALRPGGLVVVESFASDARAPRRRPVDIDPVELLRAFEGFRISCFEDVDGVSEWDPQPTRLVRLVARKW